MPSKLLALFLAWSVLLTNAASALAPPSRYDFTPRVKVKVVRSPTVPALCRNRFEKVGCAYTVQGTCYIIIATKLPPGWYHGVYRHERAHCNGWGAHHPH